MVMCISNDYKKNSIETTNSDPTMKSNEADIPTTQTKKIGAKSVRFSEGNPTIIANNLKAFNTKEYFWQDSDYRRFLRMASLIAIEVRKLSVPRKPLDYEDVLTRTLLACEESAAHIPTEDLNSDQEVVVQGIMISPHLFTALSNWIQAGSSRRGLEKLIVPIIGKCKNEKRQASIKAVLDAQKQLIHDRSNPQCQHDYEDKETFIRRASEKVTR